MENGSCQTTEELLTNVTQKLHANIVEKEDSSGKKKTTNFSSSIDQETGICVGENKNHKIITCKYCGNSHLVWKKSKKNVRYLFDIRTLCEHNCREKNKEVPHGFFKRFKRV